MDMRFGAAAAAFTLVVGAKSSFADVTHVVQKGQTLASIAHEYHLRPQALADANRLKKDAVPKVGQTLVIPVDHPADSAHRAERGSIRASRFGETVHVRVRDSHGVISDGALKTFQSLMRQGAASFPVDPHLLSLVSSISDHFGGRTIEVVSGYRSYSSVQYAPHSNHNLGRALDFRIDGVQNEDVWAFCRSFRKAGCGYYPNSGFVHIDVRDIKASWIDRSLPGESPQYDAPEALAAKTTPTVTPSQDTPNPL